MGFLIKLFCDECFNELAVIENCSSTDLIDLSELELECCE